MHIDILQAFDCHLCQYNDISKESPTMCRANDRSGMLSKYFSIQIPNGIICEILLQISNIFNAGAYHLISNSPTKSILSNSQHSTPRRAVGLDQTLHQQQPKLPMGLPNKGYVMLPLRKIGDSPNHLIQIQHSNLDNYCRKLFPRFSFPHPHSRNFFSYSFFYLPLVGSILTRFSEATQLTSLCITVTYMLVIFGHH